MKIVLNEPIETYNKLSEDRVNIMFKKMWFNDLYNSKVRGI
jgi:type I restriction enzyme R subunit